jgi:hypothetical protein
MRAKKSSQVEAIESVTAALARFRADDQFRRSSLAQLRDKYLRLESLKDQMSQYDRERFEEIGELIKALEPSE